MESNFQSSMPLPPEHYKLIDPSNPTSLPPPPIPTEKTIHVFGIPIHETYRDQFENLEKDLQKLYPTTNFNHKAELKKLNISLLFNFLELIDILIKNPQLYPKKLEEIKMIMINMHHLMNTYRPHQARQILIEILQTQVQRKQLLLNTIDSKLKEVQQTVSKVTKELKDSSSSLLSYQKISSLPFTQSNNTNVMDWIPSQHHLSIQATKMNITNWKSTQSAEDSSSTQQFPQNYLKMKRILDRIIDPSSLS